MRRLVLVLAMTLLAACPVTIDVGTLDGGVQPVGDLCAPELPAADCTSDGDTCGSDLHCDGRKCNFSTRRCFDSNARCEGTPCTFDADCGTGEACNDALGRCFRVAASQKCRPCTFDDDCGSTGCKRFDKVCE